MNVAQALSAGVALGLERLDAQLLLLHALGREPSDRGWLLAHDTDALATPLQEAYLSLCERRSTGEPLAYIVGEKEFYGLLLKVDRRVLVPRPDTETLVEWGLEVLGCRCALPQPADAGPVVIDLGTGSGAIALAIRKHCAAARVEATDASAEALAVARANAQRLGLEVAFSQGSWLDGKAGHPYDLIASNPPYVREGDPHLAALHHEPAGALASGADGLDDLRTIIAQAPAHLAPGGWLLLEHGYDQAAEVRALLTAAGLAEVQSRRDLAGIERCSGGRRLELG